MATAIKPPGNLLAVTKFDRVLAVGAVAMLVAMTAAIVRGRADWGSIPIWVWPHLRPLRLPWR